jgi:hypothetical protein
MYAQRPRRASTSMSCDLVVHGMDLAETGLRRMLLEIEETADSSEALRRNFEIVVERARQFDAGISTVAVRLNRKLRTHE